MFPIRAVVDDNVDRPGVEAQQCVKLTGTNRSIGLIVLIVHVHRPVRGWPRAAARTGNADERDLYRSRVAPRI